MRIRLVAITQPLVKAENGATMSAEDFIVYTARVSNPSNQLNLDTGPKLLRYCVEHKHWSVFEQVHVTAEILTSRAIAQQILRHRSFAFQEFSQRYAVATEFEKIEIRKQGEKNRQGGEEIFDPVISEEDLGDGEKYLFTASASIRTAVEQAQEAYQSLLDVGVAKECARMILPLCTQTRLYMTGSLRSWIHYFDVRCDSHAQKEHRLIAESIRKDIAAHFPVVAVALNWYA